MMSSARIWPSSAGSPSFTRTEPSLPSTAKARGSQRSGATSAMIWKRSSMVPRVTVYLFCSEGTGVGQGVGVGTARTGVRQPASAEARKGRSRSRVYDLRKRAQGLFEGEAGITGLWIELRDELKVERAGRVGTGERDPRFANGTCTGLCAVRD